MVMQKLNVRIVSVLLILVFVQKLGGEMWLHNWLHEANRSHSVASAGKGKPVIQKHQLICNCYEDVMMPLIESDVVHYDQFTPYLTAVILTHYTAFLSGDKKFSSLRGPPVDDIRC